MSHLVSIETRSRDPVALGVACQKLGLPPPRWGKTRVYQAELEGWIVQLPRWTYPVVIHPQTGVLAYDNYNGEWGDSAQVGRLLQRYAAEKALLEARRAGLTPCETVLPVVFFISRERMATPKPPCASTILPLARVFVGFVGVGGVGDQIIRECGDLPYPF